MVFCGEKIFKTDLITYEGNRWRRVYSTKEGKLFFRWANSLHETYRNYCIKGEVNEVI